MTQDDGLVTAMTEVLTPAEVTRAFDPAAPWVILSTLRIERHGRTPAPPVPPVARQGSEPTTATDGPLGFDLLFSTDEFLDLATELRSDAHAGGVVAQQFRVEPTNVLRFNHGPDRAGRYRAFGLVVGVVMTQGHGNAQLTTLEDAEMDAALARLEGSAG